MSSRDRMPCGGRRKVTRNLELRRRDDQVDRANSNDRADPWALRPRALRLEALELDSGIGLVVPLHVPQVDFGG